mmetsp:Transcript_122195/g.243275  ORF Transcript_122195/g.243275 Transcript_122195/m.243275 type:complete len:196 (+) Transcript_122195:84-671(+)
MDTEMGDMISRSLQIKNDKRYQDIDYYQKTSETADSHYARMIQRSRRMQGLPEEQTVLKEDSSHAEIASWNEEFDESDVFWSRKQSMKEPATNIQGRTEWQNSFDHRIRRLLQDFDFTEAPDCRLKHLDKMHEWFDEHGAKQTRKAKEGPSYIKLERTEERPAGSTLRNTSLPAVALAPRRPAEGHTWQQVARWK